MIDREYIRAENKAYDNLVRKGYFPQGADHTLKTVCVMWVEHTEFKDHPVKRGERKLFFFNSWQEADAALQ